MPRPHKMLGMRPKPGPSPRQRGLRAALLLASLVLALLAVQLLQLRPPAPTPTPTPQAPPSGDPFRLPHVPTPTADAARLDPSLGGLAPMELNWILCRLAQRKEGGLTAAQREAILRVLEGDLRFVKSANPLWIEYDGYVRQALSPAQKAHITAALSNRPALSHPGGGPMHPELFTLLESRSGIRFMAMDPQELARRAQALPFQDPGAARSALNPEDLAYGLLLLERDPKLKISKDQAIQTLPWVRLQNALYQAHQREKAAILGALTAAQLHFITEARRSYAGGTPPLTMVDEVVAVLRKPGH